MGEKKEDVSDKDSVKSRSRSVSRSSRSVSRTSRSTSTTSSRSHSSSSRSSDSSRSSSGRSSSRSSGRSVSRSGSSSGGRTASRNRKRSYSRSRSRSPRRSSDRHRYGSRKYSPRRRSPDRRRRSRSRSYTRKNKNKRLVIRDLTQNVTKEHVKEIFENYGTITHIDMVPLKRYEGSMHRGYCFIEYDDPEDALKAVKYMNDGWLDGRRIRVDLSVPRNASKRFNSPPRRRYSSPRRDFGRRRYSRSPR
ncbi:RNA-binding protein with serine-rich domain 1 [Strongyloides ratti]|uniref:RNA-binding protein with serine-rich domain 1 n=1 Tax=Strongyloides ratti TaxID=34506 RepID=A0A090L9N9_STRRB|nr:RNA-binding protein with serine-rich domain 1 [Strongyloides ratti]CEF64853.1 RNA-binding protein with serine-rich domain 1 [Strongyloides ratti]